MKISDQEIENLIANSQWRKVIEHLIDIVQTDDATLHDYAAFIEAVSSGEFTDCYEIAIQCFIKADKLPDKNPQLIHILYLRIEPIISFLGLFYFDDRNSKNLPKEFYFRARFLLFIKSSRFLDAFQTITKLLQEDPRPEYYFQRSKLYGMQRKFKLALDDISAAINLQPSGALYYQRALLNQRMNKFQEALEDFDMAINYSNQNYQYYFDRGVLQENMGHYKNAIDDFKKVIQLKPQYLEAFQETAWCKHKTQKSEEGLMFINIAIGLDSRNVSNYYIRGSINNAINKYEDAIKDLEKAISLDNQSSKEYSAKIIHQKAWAEFRLKKFNEAQASINKAIKMNPKDISLYLLAMDIEFFGTKDYYIAQGHAKAILKLDANNQRALIAMKEIQSRISF